MEFFQNKKFNKLVYSVVALTLMVLLLFTVTYAWLSSGLLSTMNSNDFITIDPDSGLEMNYGNQDMNQSTIDINKVVSDDFKFYECSSYNGKKVFFPISEYNPNSDGDKDFTSAKTKDFIYREATVNDKNTKYISIDLTLSSANEIPVWLSNDTRISGTAAGAIRIAFIDNSPDGKALVFDSADSEQHEEVKCVQTVKADGSADAVPIQPINALGSYTFDNEYGNVLFNLEAGVEKSITVVIWLEGADLDCTASIAGLEDLEIFIKFSTSSEDEKTFYFVDHTLEKWVDDQVDGKDCYVYAINQAGKKSQMTKSDNYENDHTWIVDLPVSTTSIKFARYNPELQENKPQEWNYWEAGAVGECTTYNAYAHNTGIWDENFQGETITFYDKLPDKCTVNQTDTAFMYVKYSTVDGNGNTVNIEHRMSHPKNDKWQIVIPKDVTTITFNWYKLNTDGTTDFNTRQLYWENTARGTSTVFTAFDYSVGTWGTMDTITFADVSNYNYLRDNFQYGDEMYVSFTVTDGNGNEVECTYKMETQWDYARWQVDIPSYVNDVNFLWWNSDKSGYPNYKWYTTDRGNSTYFTTQMGDGEDYWTSEILYVDTSNAAIEDGVMYAAYFFNDNGDSFWTGMRATSSDGKYMVGVPDGYNKVIFCRMASFYGYYDEEIWYNEVIYNQTYNLTIGSHNTYIISGYTGEYTGDREYMSGYWSNRTLYVDAAAAYAGDGVMYAAYFFDNNGNSLWTGMRATTSSGKYIVGVPVGYNKVIFCRRDNSTGPFNWPVHNQTFDLTIGTHSTYIISRYNDNEYNLDGYWDENS